MPFLTRSPSQGDLDTHQGFGEVRDLCCGRSGATDPGQPRTSSHHWRADDASGECFEWDLLWVGPYDAVISEMIVVVVKAKCEPRL